MARKRPKLLPVIDSVVEKTLNHPRRQSNWMILRAALREDDRALCDILTDARAEAEIGHDISLIRCFGCCGVDGRSVGQIPSRPWPILMREAHRPPLIRPLCSGTCPCGGQPSCDWQR